MKLWSTWKKKPFGKRLAALHAWNAWLVLVLAVSGMLLFFQPFRELGRIRVLTKEAHIWLGLLSVVVLLLYLPSLIRHIRQLKGKPEQQWNLGVVLVLLVGWIVSGIVLWQFRRLPPVWSNGALLVHDLFTWVGVPYAIYHSVSRSRWLKVKQRKTASADGEPMPAAPSLAGSVRHVLYTRRSFIRWSVAGVLVLLVGPKFARWLFGGGGAGVDLADYIPGSDGNHMVPEPVPHPDSVVPIGGGSKGEFRIYSVTPIPAFSSDNWAFTIGGLVNHPQKWNWKQFTDIERKVQVSDFHCVTGWSVYHNTWEGIPLSKLLEMAGIQPKARFVKFYSGDGVYTDTLTLAQAAVADVMVAVMLDGKPIPQDLGGPVRLIVPKMYAYKSVKWLQGIELIADEHIGYWEVRGYDIDAWVLGLKPKQANL
ncbi:molybdopterin-dependent oxidoreductase [Paenibacillus koleovorans]|uniref:molybdopterin-dependent oxidoreductase n=1 Tax=Paenibacillus koleovorans TaxID=121608 RepID=UPI000FDC0EFB|nr:molybdopterin-dependent oxidoreductase [Paenibacillus koleovorans]